jgi:hypothetical protein
MTTNDAGGLPPDAALTLDRDPSRLPVPAAHAGFPLEIGGFRALDIHVKALGEGNAATQRALKALVTFYTEWKKPAEAAAYTARLKPVEAKAPAAAAKQMVHSGEMGYISYEAAA